MAVLTFSEIQNIAYDRAQVNVSTDAPISAAEFARLVNEAYADVYAASGGRLKTVASATTWTSAQTATGVVTGILTDIEDVRHVYASTSSGSTGQTAGDVELDPVDLPRLQFLRKASGHGAYTVPKVYHISRLATTTPASVNLVQLNYYPNVTGFYFPITYVPQFTPIDASTVTTPDVNDIESRDIANLTAAKIAPLVDRAELVPSILADISARTAKALERKIAAMLDARADR